jgi:Fic family protein
MARAAVDGPSEEPVGIMNDPLGFVFLGAEPIGPEMTSLMTDIETADSLYREFPSFAEWTGLTEADVELWDRFAARLAMKRTAASPEAFRQAVEVAMRAAAMDTGAIEGLYSVDRGLTLTVALQTLAWQHMIDEKGPEVRGLFEAQLTAYELVLDAVTKRLPIIEAWIRALHETICSAQPSYRVLTQAGWQDHELARGRYKTAPNHVRLANGGLHAYAPVDLVPIEMRRLVESLADPAFAVAHPLLQASYAHYALVNVHPFADGNGRVARALASVYFYRAASIPLVVFADQQRAYFDVLEAADRGEAAPLVAFFRERALDTMQLAGESLVRSAGKGDEVAEALFDPLYGDQMAIALRLLVAVEQGLTERLAAHPLPAGVEGRLARRQQPAEERDGWEAPEDHLALELRTARPPYRCAEARLQVLIHADPAAMFAFRLAASGSDDAPEVRLADASPELTERLRDRVRRWVDRQLARLLEELQAS